ncbi:MAG: hypothetical protein LQ341_003327 [Variospora aurantia]|nr:MAG: hypothetical protein LQ341_003327 [Variospora aurantia]
MDGLDEYFQDGQNIAATVEVAASLAELGAAKPPPPPPPPPYTRTQAQPQAYPLFNEKPPIPSTLMFRPQQAPPSSRTLHVYCDRSNAANARIVDSDKTTTLWLFRVRMRKPHLTISSAVPTAAILATATYHDFSSRIDVVMRGVPITLSSRGAFKNGHTYQSPALAGATLTWKSQNFLTDLVCVDDKGVVLAQFHFKTWSLTKYGSLELLRSDLTSGYLMEEVVVTGMAMVEHEMALRTKGFADIAAGG